MLSRSPTKTSAPTWNLPRAVSAQPVSASSVPVAGLRAMGHDVVGVPTDVSQLADVEKLATATIDTFGAVHVLCNNAGVSIFGRNEEVSQSWMPARGAARIGLTAGASTPNNKIGDTVARIFATRGIDPATIE